MAHRQTQFSTPAVVDRFWCARDERRAHDHLSHASRIEVRHEARVRPGLRNQRIYLVALSSDALRAADNCAACKASRLALARARLDSDGIVRPLDSRHDNALVLPRLCL